MNLKFSLVGETAESENLAAVQRLRPRGPQAASSGGADCLGPMRRESRKSRDRGTRAPKANTNRPWSPWVETSRPRAGGWGRWGGGSPRQGREQRARGSGRAARAAAAASSPPRLRRRCLLPPPRSASLAPSPRGWLRRRRRRRVGRACAGREVSAAREGKFQVEGRPRAGASSCSPPAASWRSRAARPCTSSSPSRRPR